MGGIVLFAAAVIGAMVWSARFARGPVRKDPAKERPPAPLPAWAGLLLVLIATVGVLGIVYAIVLSFTLRR